jgi:hypothetical protein
MEPGELSLSVKGELRDDYHQKAGTRVVVFTQAYKVPLHQKDSPEGGIICDVTEILEQQRPWSPALRVEC